MQRLTHLSTTCSVTKLLTAPLTSLVRPSLPASRTARTSLPAPATLRTSLRPLTTRPVSSHAFNIHTDSDTTANATLKNATHADTEATSPQDAQQHPRPDESRRPHRRENLLSPDSYPGTRRHPLPPTAATEATSLCYVPTPTLSNTP